MGFFQFTVMRKIRRATHRDWSSFLTLARAENWLVPGSETKLFQTLWSDSVYVVEENFEFCGLVTAVTHQKNGWIGNLIVPEKRRGKGFGTDLFLDACSRLKSQGVLSLWLTASEQGRGLYEKNGFQTITTIERWISVQSLKTYLLNQKVVDSKDKLYEADQKAWGEKRNQLLATVSSSGQVCSLNDSVALLQTENDFNIIGLWYTMSGCLQTNEHVLKSCFSLVSPGQKIIIDLFASSPIRALLPSFGFKFIGDNHLMCCHDNQHVQTSMMVSLASLGSFG
jgi:ribosomal protein S18 acetylase RimI-like enzyme